MNTNGRPRMPEPNVAASFADFTHDVIELAELQSQLLACDVKKTSENARVSMLFFAIGVGLLLGCVPVALIALAELLKMRMDWSTPAAYAVATLVGLLCSATALGVGYAQFKTGFEALGRSREELNRNIAWLKSSLRNRGRASAESQSAERF